MSNVLIDKIPNGVAMKKLTHVFGNYVKLVADLNKNILYGGCNLHADCERELIQLGSEQEDIWGGGIDLLSKKIDYTALINIRPKQGNDSMEIIDPLKRKRFSEIVKRYFPNYD